MSFGGNAKDRRKWERAVKREAQRSGPTTAAPMNRVPNIQPNSTTPFYERSLFWGLVGLAAAIVLTVVAAVVKDLRWLLILAWLAMLIPLWLACREWRLQVGRWSLFIFLCGITGFSLWRLNVKLRPKPNPMVAATSEKAKEPPSAKDIHDEFCRDSPWLCTPPDVKDAKKTIINITNPTPPVLNKGEPPNPPALAVNMQYRNAGSFQANRLL